MALIVLLLASTLLHPACAQTARMGDRPRYTLSTISDTRNLAAWFESRPQLRRKLELAAGTADAATPEGREADLRDALAPKAAEGAVRWRAGAERAPSAVVEECSTLENCPQAPSVLYLDGSGSIYEAVATLVRPWALLQRAKHKKLGVISIPDSSDRIFQLRLQGLEKAVLEVHAASLPGGGVTVWLVGEPDPASLYSSQRQAVFLSGS